MKKIFILIFFCFSVNAENVQDRKIFEDLNFPFQDLTYMDILTGNYKKFFNDFDLMDIVNACDENGDFKNIKNKKLSNEINNQNNILRKSVCGLIRDYLKEVLSND